MGKLTTVRKIHFWGKYVGVMLLFGIMSVLSVVLFPVAYLLRYGAKKDWLWFFMNDETDFGEKWWLEREGLKENFWTAWRWNLRNSAWNFKLLFNPKWSGGPDEMLYLKTTVENRDYDIDWPNKNGKFGTLKTYYLVEGTLYGRYGFAKEKGLIKELQLGAAGNRYKLRLKL